MKAAYHFRENDCEPEGPFQAVLTALRMASSLAHTKVFQGTLLFWHAASEVSHQGTSNTSSINIESLAQLVEEWSIDVDTKSRKFTGSVIYAHKSPRIGRAIIDS